MTPDEALTEVRKDLISAFGEALADTILASAQSAAHLPAGGCSASDYGLLIDTLAKDDRVVGMLGAFGVKERIQRWENLVR